LRHGRRRLLFTGMTTGTGGGEAIIRAGDIIRDIFLFLTTLGILGACSSVRVSSDFDREANFAAYKKYAFTKEALELPVGDLNRKRILQAVTNELEAKGFTASDRPDVWIDL